MAEFSPMMRHYLELKKTLPDTLVFYRLGDFYEMFFEDAKIASAALELVLTGRNAGVKERVPMCGVPVHALNGYLSRLINSGFKVAIVEQMEEATGKTIVNREVVRIVTPGTNLDDTEEAMIMALCENADYYYLALCNISVGTVYCHRITRNQNLLQQMIDEYTVKELVLSDRANQPNVNGVVISYFDQESEYQEPLVFELVNEEPLYRQSLTALLGYLRLTQKQSTTNIKEVKWLVDQEVLHLDYQSKLNLEIIANRNSPHKISLFQYLNHCQSAMGHRTLKQWVENPLRSLSKINYRQQVINYLNQEFLIKNQLIDCLKKVYDLERLLAKLVYRQANNKDLLALKVTVQSAVIIQGLLNDELWDDIKVEDDCQATGELLEKALNDDPALYNKDNQLFRTGYHQQLDHYRDLQQRERRDGQGDNIRR